MFTPAEWFALTVVTLFVKLAGTAFLQGYFRFREDHYTRPEDAEFYGDGESPDTELPEVDRAQRALRNDVENIPIFLFLAWCFVELAAWPAAIPIYFGIFVAARFVHTATYVWQIQPTRTIAYVVGLLVNVALAGHLVAAVLAG